MSQERHRGVVRQPQLPTAPVVAWPPHGSRGNERSPALLLAAIGGGAVLIGLIVLVIVLLSSSGGVDESALAEPLQAAASPPPRAEPALVSLPQPSKAPGRGFDKEYVKAVEEATDRLISKVKVYQTLGQRFIREGGLDPRRVTTDVTVKLRLKTLEQVTAANDDMLRALNDMPAEIRRLIGDRADAQTLDTVWRQFESNFPFASLKEYVAEERRALGTMKEILELMKQDWNAWRYDRDIGMIVFYDDAVGTRYDGMMRSLERSITKLMDLEKALFARLTAGPR